MSVGVSIGITSVAISVFGGILGMNGSSEDRVKVAYEHVGISVRGLVADAGLAFPPKRIFIRAFKSEAELEIWGSDQSGKPLRLIQTYRIAKMSGNLGPKRREGDLQVPEGLYHIDRFNPKSQFHLSLGINYPNASDRKRSDVNKPGGDIFIHGDNRSIGCLAMTDKRIEEIYILALEAKSGGQRNIPVHIYPFRMTADNMRRHLASHPNHKVLWGELLPFYERFERTRLVPGFRIDSQGAYQTR